MNEYENVRSDTLEDTTELGVASVETKGPAGSTEFVGGDSLGGISDA